MKIFNVQAESAREVSKVITRNHGDLLSYSLMNLRRILAITSISIFAAAALVAPTWAAGNPRCTAVDGEYIVTFSKGAVVANEVKNINGKLVAASIICVPKLYLLRLGLFSTSVCGITKVSLGSLYGMVADASKR